MSWFFVECLILCEFLLAPIWSGIIDLFMLAGLGFKPKRNPDQATNYRAAAGRMLAGKVLGPFRYEGTRPDDPERHRRSRAPPRAARAARVRRVDEPDGPEAGNTLDTLVTVDGRGVVRHYLQDVGSTFGIGANGAHDWDEGFEYFYQGVASGESGSSRSAWRSARGRRREVPGTTRRSAASRATSSIPPRGSRTRRRPATWKCSPTMRSGPRAACSRSTTR
jgi:hypothetical protein